MFPTILAIESSCDDTSVAVLHNGKVLSNRVAGQAVHEQYGGVVPELASRAHQQNILPVADIALQEAGIKPENLDAIAFTGGPGLMGSLLVGTGFAKGLALALNKPLIAVDHMEAHVMAHFIDDPQPEFPFLCLVVSGGHTQLVYMPEPGVQEIIGKTRDDAAGEAFDKTAKLLGLPYPGGPLIDRYAANGDPHRFRFSTARLEGLDFSFSGLKTAILYFLQENLASQPDFIRENMPDICASVQHTIIHYLMERTREALRHKADVKSIGIAGGVSANSALRKALKELGEKIKLPVFIPDFQYCTDNAGMIAITAQYKYLRGEFTDSAFKPYTRQH